MAQTKETVAQSLANLGLFDLAAFVFSLPIGDPRLAIVLQPDRLQDYWEAVRGRSTEIAPSADPLSMDLSLFPLSVAWLVSMHANTPLRDAWAVHPCPCIRVASPRIDMQLLSQ